MHTYMCKYSSGGQGLCTPCPSGRSTASTSSDSIESAFCVRVCVCVCVCVFAYMHMYIYICTNVQYCHSQNN